MAHRILIVEDDWLTARSIERALTGEGYHVDGPARSAVEASQAMQAGRPDLALVDIGLDGPADGIALASRLRQQGVPVIFVTAMVDRATLERMTEAEPLGYVSKPFSNAQLLGTVRLGLERLERQRKSDAPAAPAMLPETQTRALERIAQILADAGIWVEGTSGIAKDDPRLESLSRAERRVFDLLLTNHRVSAIARELKITDHTVRNHLKAIYRKTGVHSQAALLEHFLRQ
jgi:DNA-binding NarL/FixJ family response regulator